MFRNVFIFILILSSQILCSCIIPEPPLSTAKFEPPDGRVIHGLGQYIPDLYYSDADNWPHVNEYQNTAEEIPLIYSVYQSINPISDMIDNTDMLDIVSNHDYPYILVVGLFLLEGTDFSNLTANPDPILNGDWDDTIRSVANRIRNVSAPVFLRPGYEFGSGSDGIHQGFSGPEFIAIWHYIQSVFEQENVDDVDWVWNAVNPNQFNYTSYYPGNDAVDWWGINYFTASQINQGDGFVTAASTHGKPVMICESSPIHNSGTQNSANWNNWFVPYFNKIEEYTHIKAFIYISDPWDKPGFFDWWPDSRIDSNPTISSNYANEMQNPIYIHMDEYLQNPQIIESAN